MISRVHTVSSYIQFQILNDHLFGKELFILFAASAFRKLSSIYVFSYFPFGFEGRIWDLIVSVPDHCLSFYFNLDSSFSCLSSTCALDNRFYFISSNPFILIAVRHHWLLCNNTFPNVSVFSCTQGLSKSIPVNS